MLCRGLLHLNTSRLMKEQMSVVSFIFVLLQLLHFQGTQNSNISQVKSFFCVFSSTVLLKAGSAPINDSRLQKGKQKDMSTLAGLKPLVKQID